MKSTRILAGMIVLAAIAFAPVANAAKLAASCNQTLVDCIDQATETFSCCAYAADSTTVGLLSGYCAEKPTESLSLGGRPDSSVAACLVTFNGTTGLCNVAYLFCELTHPAAPFAPNAQ